MERRARRKYTDEFKEQVVKLYLNGKSQTEIIRKYELTPSSFNRWIKQHKESGSFKEKYSRNKDDIELIKLRKEIAQLKMENDILKQAALIMGRK